MSITSACRPKPISCRSSPRNRLRISVCSASAVRFIGTQRPSIAIENDVSTSSATAAWVRASVSCTSTSSMWRRGPAPPSWARRSTPFRIVRGMSHGSVSPNAHGRVAPERSPAAPALFMSRWPGAAAHPLGDVAQQRLAELAHRLRRELELAVGAALQRAAVAQRLLEPLQGAGVDGGVVAELAGELVEVDVVHPRAAVGLGELLGEVVEVGEVLEDAGAVAEAEALVAVHALRAAPVLAGPQRLQVGVEPVQRLHQLR